MACQSALCLAQVKICCEVNICFEECILCVLCSKQGLLCVLSNCAWHCSQLWLQHCPSHLPRDGCNLVTWYFWGVVAPLLSPSPWFLLSALPHWRHLYLSRSFACQCREISIAQVGCCGFWFACLYIQKLLISSELINMALTVEKEKNQTPVIRS